MPIRDVVVYIKGLEKSAMLDKIAIEVVEELLSDRYSATEHFWLHVRTDAELDKKELAERITTELYEHALPWRVEDISFGIDPAGKYMYACMFNTATFDQLVRL